MVGLSDKQSGFCATRTESPRFGEVMYRYTDKIVLKRSVSWRFVPPQDCIDAGVVTRQTFKDGRTARYEIPRLIKLVDSFRKGDIAAGNIGHKSTILQIYKYYVTTNHFKSLEITSQNNYNSTMLSIINTYISSKSFGSIKIKDLNAIQCTEAYEEWVKCGSVAKANRCSRILSLLINYCISIDIIRHNPLSKIKKKTHTPVSVVWLSSQVEKFLDSAFSQFEWRNVGLIALMCYEWGQRPNDIRLLEWPSINFDEAKIKIKQSKRGATVELPIATETLAMLRQQHIDWGFQPYVVPHKRPSDGAYRPLTRVQIPNLANEIKINAELPLELKIGGLRKSVIVEMIDAGVDHLQIMSVTGHQNPSSLGPYQKHTFSSAKSALDRRNNNE